MNLVYEDPSTPIRLLLVNPVGKSSVMIAMKAMRGVIFGINQLIDLILLVYSNDVQHAERLRWELEAGAFPCNNSITITSDIPKLTDADIFVFVTSLSNPNSLDFDNLDSPEVFDCLYLLMTIAKNFEWAEHVEPIEKNIFKKIKQKVDKEVFRPAIVTDGLVALDIIKSFSKNLPNDIFFCPTPIAGVAKSILGDHLKVQCTAINHVHVWAANDDIFHIEVSSPIYLREKSKKRGKCEWSMMADREFEELDIDFTQFNPAWLKKEFIEKVGAVCSNHPHGFIYKGAKISKTLQSLWKTRQKKSLPQHYTNLGIISDGSMESYKGLPYFFPIVFDRKTFSTNDLWKDDVHLKQEMKRINNAVLTHHRKGVNGGDPDTQSTDHINFLRDLMSYCKRFYHRNVIRKEFLPASVDSTEETTATSTGTGSEPD